MLPMSSKENKGLGLLGLLALIALVIGAISVGAYALQAADVIDLPLEGESMGKFVLLLVLAAPALAVGLGLLGSKFADSKGRKGKCLGIALVGVLLLGYVAWTIFSGGS